MVVGQGGWQMSTLAIPQSLSKLVRFLNNLESRVPIEGLQQHLLELEVTLEDLRPFMHFGEHCYQRNLICQSQWYELLCICWRNGQQSVIHDHAHSTCGLRIISGAAVETIFQRGSDGLVTPQRESHYVEGQVCCAQDADIHQVCNVQPDDADLVTLHIYSPPLQDMCTYERADDRG